MTSELLPGPADAAPDPDVDGSLYRGWPSRLHPVNVLSFGAGQDSTAMLELVIGDPRCCGYRRNLHLVFADTRAELPETYAHVRRVKSACARLGVPFAHLRPIMREKSGAEHEGLESYCLSVRVIPAKRPDHRWCTDRIKIQPIHQWVRSRFPGRFINMLIGFGAEEASRKARGFRIKDHLLIRKCYPLMEAGLCRHRCVDLIRRSGRFPVPLKSGCTFCPFAKKGYWKWLAATHPDRFQQAVALEKNGRGYARGFYLSHKPLEELIHTPDRRRKAERCICGAPKNEYFGTAIAEPAA